MLWPSQEQTFLAANRNVPSTEHAAARSVELMFLLAVYSLKVTNNLNSF
jgi:hypothetical protein